MVRPATHSFPPTSLARRADGPRATQEPSVVAWMVRPAAHSFSPTLLATVYSVDGPCETQEPTIIARMVRPAAYSFPPTFLAHRAGGLCAIQEPTVIPRMVSPNAHSFLPTFLAHHAGGPCPTREPTAIVWIVRLVAHSFPPTSLVPVYCVAVHVQLRTCRHHVDSDGSFSPTFTMRMVHPAIHNFIPIQLPPSLIPVLRFTGEAKRASCCQS